MAVKQPESGVTLKSIKFAAIAAAAFLACGAASAAGSVSKTSLYGSTVTKHILAGDGDVNNDYIPGNLVDANVPTSPFSGVVSINIRYDIGGANASSYICSGALLDSWNVMTAGHCIDEFDNGVAIDLTGNNDVRVVFNSDGNVNALVSAKAAIMHPDYDGFNNCDGGGTGCLNDDIAIIHLSEKAPDSAARYSIWGGELTEGQAITMVGYGTSGTGLLGHISGTASFTTKKSAQNRTDLFDLDDEQGFAAGPKEVWYSDFDGTDFRGQFQDTFCQLGWSCTGDLGTNVEGNIGGGDSGGPSFVEEAGVYYLVGNNTFGGRWPDQVSGTYGTYFGGMAVAAYSGWIGEVSAVPEPGTYALFLAGLVGMAGLVRRRRRQA